MNINKAIIIGRITRQVELKILPNGTPVASLSVATNRTYTKDGQKHEDTEFHNIVVFGRQAESCNQYLQQGQEVAIEGRIQTRSWESQGAKHYRTEIVAENVQFGQRSGGSQNQGRTYTSQAAPAKKSEPVRDPSVPVIEYPDEEINVDDIPF